MRHVSYRRQFEHFHFSSSSRLHWPAIGRLPTQIKSVFTLLKHFFFPCVEKSPEAFDRAAVAVQSNLFAIMKYWDCAGKAWACATADGVLCACHKRLTACRALCCIVSFSHTLTGLACHSFCSAKVLLCPEHDH